jgi:hypothetical protein
MSRGAPIAEPARLRLAQALALALLATAACVKNELVTLGYGSPPPYHFETPQLVTELASANRTDNPTLTGDLLEIFFTSDRVSGNGDVWVARRASVNVPFGTPTAVSEVNTTDFETSSAISTDGLTLWFGSDRGGGVGGNDIWVSGRASRTAPWSTPINVVSLNTVADDIPRPTGQHDLIMPLASTAAVPSVYQTYFAGRVARGAPFAPPVPIPSIDHPNKSSVDAFLTDDGLTVFYSSAPVSDVDGGAADAGPTADAGAPTADLFVAWRRSTDEDFSAFQPLDDLNTSFDERDPWLTPDGKTLYFTSDRGGVLNIYTAAVKPR